jgi:hypothetical protein
MSGGRARPEGTGWLAPDSARLAETILVGVTGLVAVAVFFRETVFSGGRLVTGNVGDARLYIVTLEHWLAAIRGDVSFRSPIFFWPERGVLGYTDCVALFVPPYALARLIGLDRYLAFQVTLMLLKAVGFVAMYLLLRRSVRVDRGLAALGAALFTISNASYLAAGHTQLLSVALVPVVWLLGWRAYARRSTPSLVTAAVLLALLLFTSFYIGWFTIFVSALAAVVAAGLVAADEGVGAPWRRIRAAARGARGRIVLATVTFLVALAPFLAVYLPTLRKVGGRHFEEVLAYVPTPWHAVDVGPGNLVWGALVRIPGSAATVFSDSELRRGWPPLLLGVLAITVLVGSWRRVHRGRRAQPPRESSTLVLTLGLTVILAWALVARYGDVTPWRVVWALVPGASAIRVPVRIAHVLNALVIGAVMAGLDAFRRPDARASGGAWRWRTLVVAVLGIALLVEQLNVASIAAISREAELAKFSRIGPPLDDCRQFYVVRTPTNDIMPTVEAQIDAMLVAYEYMVPTLDGYSGNLPPRWHLNLFDDGAPARARRWAVAHRVARGLCVLDLTTATWARDAPPAR